MKEYVVSSLLDPTAKMERMGSWLQDTQIEDTPNFDSQEFKETVK